ncbi:MAG TPA: YdeI/OmpD-associated family protein [Chitinophagaceae bacterium]|nr:YdeI/OmpD-associated family protein [Chitinophagaceae bacterium]
MRFAFKARIYKVGINPCVKVPLSITAKLKADKGYIPIKGTIQHYFFQHTLCPVKGEKYRLHVNGPMLKGGNLKLGDVAHFMIEQDTLERNKNVPMPPIFRKKLAENKLLTAFQALTPSRQKEVNRYLGNLKTEEALNRNIDKLINVLKGKMGSPLLRMN